MIQDKEEIFDEPRLPAKAFIVGSLTQFAVGLHSPFLQTYLVDMQTYLYGAKDFTQLGAFRSVGTFAPTVLQPVWGATSDKVGHTKAFVAFGTLMGLTFVYLFLWAATPIDILIIYAIQSMLFSIQIPTWLSLVGGLMGENNRGSELGKLGICTNVASLVATLISGFLTTIPGILPFLRSSFGDTGPILFPTVEAWREVFYLPFMLTAAVGIISSILSLTIKEQKKVSNGPRKFPPILRLLSQSGDFRRFSFIAALFSFSMSMAWPYFIVVQRDWLHNSIFEIAFASAVMTLSTGVFTIPFGRLSDRVGRKPLIIMGRSLYFLVPIMYALATNVWMICAANTVVGISSAATVNAITAYIYDIAPPEERGAHIAVYNTFTGLVLLMGAFFAGIIGQFISTFTASEHFAVFTMLMLSGVLRFVTSFFNLLIREPKEYSSTIWTEFRTRIQGRRHDVDIA